MTKLAVGWPWSVPFVWTKFVDAAFNVRDPKDVEVKWIRGIGWSPARRRIDLVEKALAWGADLIMFFDADQIPEPDILERLYARVLEGYLPISAMVPTRELVQRNVGAKLFQPLAWRWAPTKLDENGRPILRQFRSQKEDPDMVELVKQDGSMQQVHMIGAGCIMFHRDHILALKKPWFFETFNKETYQREATMDTRFAWRLNIEASAPLWCDTSIKIKHLHDMEIDSSFQYRFNETAIR